QSGQIEAVGFEMYTTMLERTIRELKGEEEITKVPTQLNLALNLRIPNDYIPEENQRLRMYKRVAGIEDEKQLEDVRAELIDRYGVPPAPVRNLLDAAALKLLSERVGVASIDRKQHVINIKFSENANVDPSRLAQFVAGNKGAQFSPNGTLRFNLKSTHAEDALGRLTSLLQELSGLVLEVERVS
ncbi:MAG TPA: TRCF domain-containing protein, partial [Terriglobales bacterium]